MSTRLSNVRLFYREWYRKYGAAKHAPEPSGHVPNYVYRWIALGFNPKVQTRGRSYAAVWKDFGAPVALEEWHCSLLEQARGLLLYKPRRQSAA